MSWQVKQQVNFYTDDFRPPHLPEDIALLLLQLAANLGLVVVLLLFTYLFSVWQNSNLIDSHQRHDFLQTQLEEMKASRPPLVADAGLTATKEKSQRDLISSQKILRFLTRGQLEESKSFTTLVEQLGEQDIKGVWLQKFSIDQQGTHIALQGYVDDPVKLSPYVASLVQRSAYKNKAFRYIDVKKAEGTSWLKFELDTQAKQLEKNGLVVNPLLKSMAAGGRQ